MRRILATFFKSHGFNDIVAAKSLGHGSTQVTRDFYLRPIESELTKAAGMLDELVMSKFI